MCDSPGFQTTALYSGEATYVGSGRGQQGKWTYVPQT